MLDKAVVKKIKNIIDRKEPMVVLAHINPDGDAIGSAYGLHLGFKTLGLDPTVACLDEVPESDTLWLLATGTAIGPFLSMLGDDGGWQKYKHVVLVHGVRKHTDLVYQQQICDLCSNHPLTFVPVVSQEEWPDGLQGRITNAITSGELFSHVKVTPTPQNSQFMLCGNPEMVKETTQLLLDLGFTRNRRAKPGNITVEQYW